MRQDGSVHMQDPTASPTFALSRATQPVPDVPPTLRRNLFGSHLSRRPVVPFVNSSTERMPDPFGLTPAAPQQPDSLHSSPRHHQHQQGLHNNGLNVYETRRSPSRSISPVKSQAHMVASSSIIVLDPATGRPQLPAMPLLPARMPEASDDEDEEEDEDDMVNDDDDSDSNTTWRRAKAFENHSASQYEIDLNSSSMVGLSTQPARLHEILDTSGGRIDLLRVQSILTEMQSQQKARAKAILLPESSSLSSLEGASEGRQRGKARAATKPQIDNHRPHILSGGHRIGGIGATLDPADKDELLSAIMTGLSKRIQQADEDAWMFGDERFVTDGASISGGFNFATRDEVGFDY